MRAVHTSKGSCRRVVCVRERERARARWCEVCETEGEQALAISRAGKAVLRVIITTAWGCLCTCDIGWRCGGGLRGKVCLGSSLIAPRCKAGGSM
eukprot:583309-Rhodomonas_salina.2